MKPKRVLWALGLVVALFAAAAGGIFYCRHAVSTHEQRTTGRLLADQALLVVHWKEFETNELFRQFIQAMANGLRSQAHTVRFISLAPGFKGEQRRDDVDRDLLARFARVAAEERTSAGRPLFVEPRGADRTEYRYCQPIYAEKQCFGVCHQPVVRGLKMDPAPSPTGRAAPGEQKWNDGDLMAVVEVAIPLPLNSR